MFFKKIDSEKISNEGIRIDVRTYMEYEQGHIDKAIHIPYELIANEIHKYAKDKTILIGLYCKSGIRAQIAKKTLKSLGYNNVINEKSYNKILNRLRK